MTTELCTYTRNACDIARRTGVERIELCAAPLEGGTTPSAGLIRYARSLPGLRLSVMIRPRGGDFLYTDDEVALMAEEIRLAREYGADGVVFGLLTPDGEVDETRTAQLVREAEGMEVTFHRAFDMTRDSRQALEAVIRTGCRRVLTSGGRNTAQEGIETLRALAAQATGRIEIMAGSGVGPSNARLLAATGVDALHFSARRERESGNKKLPGKVKLKDEIVEYKQAEDIGLTSQEDLFKKSSEEVAKSIDKIVEVEGPVHISEVIKRVKDSCNIKRAGANLKKAVNGAISASEDAGNIIKIGDFLYDSASNDVSIRKRHKPNIDLISDEEIAKNIERILVHKQSLSAKSLPKEVSRNFGFKSTSKKTANKINSVLDLMIADNRVKLDNDIVELK